LSCSIVLTVDPEQSLLGKLMSGSSESELYTVVLKIWSNIVNKLTVVIVILLLLKGLVHPKN